MYSYRIEKTPVYAETRKLFEGQVSKVFRKNPNGRNLVLTSKTGRGPKTVLLPKTFEKKKCSYRKIEWKIKFHPPIEEFGDRIVTTSLTRSKDVV